MCICLERRTQFLETDQTCAKIPKISEILDLWDPESGILQDLGSHFFPHGILEILVPVTATLPWDPRNLGSQTAKILPDLRDPGSSLTKVSWDLEGLGSYTTIMSLDFEHPLSPMKFCFWLPISIRCLNLSTDKNFSHTLIQPFCVDLKTSSRCWFLYKFSIIDMSLTLCGGKKMNAYFNTS